jgi:hypothetical protein
MVGVEFVSRRIGPRGIPLGSCDGGQDAAPLQCTFGRGAQRGGEGLLLDLGCSHDSQDIPPAVPFGGW